MIFNNKEKLYNATNTCHEITVMKLVNIEDQHVKCAIRGTNNKNSFL